MLVAIVVWYECTGCTTVRRINRIENCCFLVNIYVFCMYLHIKNTEASFHPPHWHFNSIPPYIHTFLSTIHASSTNVSYYPNPTDKDSHSSPTLTNAMKPTGHDELWTKKEKVLSNGVRKQMMSADRLVSLETCEFRPQSPATFLQRNVVVFITGWDESYVKVGK